MRILLTSVGRRSYLVDYFKAALKLGDEVHVANSTKLSPAFVVADKAVVTPLIYDPEYVPFLMHYCYENEINAIIPLFDIDLPVLAANKDNFIKIGVKVIVSSIDVIDICNDKLRTYKFLIDNHFATPMTFVNQAEVKLAINNGELTYPLIVKPRWGMGSIGLYQADNDVELSVFINKTKKDITNSYLKYQSIVDLDNSVIIQEKLVGQEYNLDIINDLQCNYQATLVKRKLAMRSGETDCAEICKDVLLEEVGSKLATKLNHIANLDVDVFIMNKKTYILDMNARFGGGYPFSHQAGANLPKAIINWLNNESIKQSLFKVKTGMVLQKDIKIVQI